MTDPNTPTTALAQWDDDAVGLLDCQTRVLALMSSNAPVSVSLDVITATLERMMPGTWCALMLTDAHGLLRHGSRSTLPADYLAAIDGLPVGPDQGSCGTAAHLGEAVAVADVLTDPRWARYRDIARTANLRSCWSTPVFDTDGRVVGTFAVYRPIVHHPTAREQRLVGGLTYLVSVALAHSATVGALTVSEERFRRAFHDSAMPYGLLDTAGCFVLGNDALGELTGRAVAPGATMLLDLVVGDDVETVAAMLAEVNSGRSRTAQRDVGIVGPDGTRRTATMTLSLVRGARGEPFQVSVALLDVTERDAARADRRARLTAEIAQRSAEAASRAKSEFLAAVSHEMRTPLQAITGFAELLGTLELDPERRTAALRHITTGASHLLGLVDDTLDLARIEAGVLPLHTETVELATAVRGVLEFLAPVAAQQQVGVTAGPCPGTVRADARRLRQVLINLVANGVRYGGPGASVRVDVVRDGSHQRITVTDTGPGIPATLRARVFEPFVRGDAPDEPPAAGQGVGLGLMLARGITEAMGGRLDLDAAEADGRGTRATVVLPAG